MRRVKAGEVDGFEPIVETYKKQIYIYCCRMLGCKQDAQDAVQDVFIKAFTKLHTYEAKVSFSSWLYKIAYHHCLNLLRKRQVRMRVSRLIRSTGHADSVEQWVALFLAATMMVGSANVYAASNASTSVPQAKVAVSTAKPEKTSVSFDDRIKELSNKLKAGQMVAYYVADQEYNRLDEIYFTSMGFVNTKYADYVAKAKALNAPTLTKPSDLPKSYSFQNAIIYLKSPERTSSLYEKLDKELRAKAASGEKFVYSDIMKSNEASAAILNFDKGKVKLQVVASYIVPEQPMGGTPVPQKKPNEKKETIVINGVECIYTTDSKGRDHLDWVDEEQQIRYSIWAESAKSDVLNYAKKMIAK
ncbi:RNA polymerase sigma factor [Paenibacillus lautus]|uniref:RNA polymerase sigma factor n=1 Tax=Paenibacillus lautus TaxID=1401 RepID=UPI002DB882F5|nr:sigma-70 family RNA polymerase sigma factor [Paenibacillus lautus]MEC0255612.1 sigma-70 family RNA polymerase sigma factor [Paenibacillus lautus]